MRPRLPAGRRAFARRGPRPEQRSANGPGRRQLRAGHAATPGQVVGVRGRRSGGRGRPAGQGPAGSLRADDGPALAGHRRAKRGHRRGVDRRVLPGPRALGRRARRGQNPLGQHLGPGPGIGIQADPVHPRSHAFGHHRDRRAGGRPHDREARVPLRRGTVVHQHGPGRRDQPHAAEDSGGAVGGDAGAARHRRRRDLHAAGAVLRSRHAEPDRARRHLPAARSPARPVPVQYRGGLSPGGRGIHDHPASHQRLPARGPDCAECRGDRAAPGGRPARAGRPIT